VVRGNNGLMPSLRVIREENIAVAVRILKTPADVVKAPPNSAD
jgi:hypothetical protein